MQRVAIIGAGVAGLGAAWGLRQLPTQITLFEKSRGVGGRVATRSHGAIRYDHGAQYFKPGSPAVDDLIHRALQTEGLVDIGRPVWTFDGAGQITPGDPALNAEPKWVYRDGISELGKRLAAALPPTATVQRQTRVARLDQTLWGWQLWSDGGADLGTFDLVLLTPPAPQSATIIEASAMDPGLRDALSAGLRQATYRAILSAVLGFDSPLPRPGDCYALVNSDREHPISWLAFEEDKPGHVPAGQSVLIVQMAPAWSVEHFGGERDEVLAEMASRAGALLGHPLPAPAWSDLQRWRYALPNTLADERALALGAPTGLFFAGDALAGPRVHLALESGLAAATAIRSQIEN